MKTQFCTLALLALAAALPAAEPVDDAVTSLGMLPNQRTGLRINADERNPFAVKAKEIAKASAPEDIETQESKIRSIFGQLRVAGIRRDRNGRFVALAGDLILRQGEEVKPVLEDQTEILIVSKIEPRQIELTFVEDKDSTQPRVLIVPVKNQVQVAQKLFGQPKGKGGLYIARGRSAPDVKQAAAAMAAAPPTAPASTTPVATLTGAQATGAAAPTPRDTRREAAALAGLSEPALAELIGSAPSLESSSSNAAPPAADEAPPPPATPAPPATVPAAAPSGDIISPPTHARRRTTPPASAESPSPAATGVVE